MPPDAIRLQIEPAFPYFASEFMKGHLLSTASRLTRSLPVCFVTLLLFVYLAGSVNSLHTFIHQDHGYAEIHSEENEKEACHIAIYHYSSEQGCHHKSHLSKNDKCSLCHLISHSDSWLSDDLTFAESVSSSSFVQCTYNLDVQSGVSLLPARAPPIA